MKYPSSILLFLLTFSSLYSKNTSANYNNLVKTVNRYMTSPCIKELENPARDSMQAIKFVRELAKKSGLKLTKIKTKSLKDKSFLLSYKDKVYDWSLWVSIGSKGISHITEIWQTTNEGPLRKKFFHIFSDTFDSWGNPTEEIEDESFFSWDKHEYGCGKLMVTIEYDKYTFVSRRLEFNK